MTTRNNCSSNREYPQYVNKKQQSKCNNSKAKKESIHKNNEEHWKRYIRSNTNRANI